MQHQCAVRVRAAFLLSCATLSVLWSLNGRAAVAQALVEVEKAKELAGRCDTLAPFGEIDLDKIEGFIRALNEPVFEKFDADCDGKILGDEKEAYFAAAKAKAEKEFMKTEESVVRRTAKRIERYRNTRLNFDDAYRIPPDPELKSAGVKVSFADVRKPSSNSSNYSFEIAAEQKPWRSYRGALPVSLGLDWSLGASRDAEESSTSRTKEDEIIFTPFSVKTTDPDERFSFKLSVGAAYVWSEETILATGGTTREKAPTFAYATEVSYAFDPKKCWSIGLKYEYKSRHAFSDKVSATVKPMLGFKFVCAGE